MRFLRLEFKTDSVIKSKGIKYIVEKNIAPLLVNQFNFTKDISSVVRKPMRAKIVISEELNKIDVPLNYGLLATKDRGSLKIKKIVD